MNHYVLSSPSAISYTFCFPMFPLLYSAVDVWKCRVSYKLKPQNIKYSLLLLYRPIKSHLHNLGMAH